MRVIVIALVIFLMPLSQPRADEKLDELLCCVAQPSQPTQSEPAQATTSNMQGPSLQDTINFIQTKVAEFGNFSFAYTPNKPVDPLGTNFPTQVTLSQSISV